MRGARQRHGCGGKAIGGVGGAVFLLLVLTGSAAPAAAAGGEWRAGALFQPQGTASETTAEIDLGYGAALERWRGRIGLGAAWLHDPDGDVTVDVGSFSLRYAFLADAAWQPHVGLGVFVQRREGDLGTVCDAQSCFTLEVDQSDVGALAAGGVDWLFARRAFVRLLGQLRLYDDDQSGQRENVLDFQVGAGLRF